MATFIPSFIRDAGPYLSSARGTEAAGASRGQKRGRRRGEKGASEANAGESAAESALADLCEPLFLAVCRYNRSARLNTPMARQQVRAEIEELFKTMGEQAGRSADPALGGQFRDVRPALVAFVDDVISHSGLPFAAEWERLGQAEQAFSPGEEFFDLLEQTLADPSAAVADRLVIFYTCVGLGFCGKHRSEPEMLKAWMNRLVARIGGRMDADENGRVSGQPYRYTDRRVLQPYLGAALVGLAVAVVALIALAFVVNGTLYYKRTNELRTAVKKLVEPPPAVAADGK